jgi:hypothetical protein
LCEGEFSALATVDYVDAGKYGLVSAELNLLIYTLLADGLVTN